MDELLRDYHEIIARVRLPNHTPAQIKAVVDECMRQEAITPGAVDVHHASHIAFSHSLPCRRKDCLTLRLDAAGEAA